MRQCLAITLVKWTQVRKTLIFSYIKANIDIFGLSKSGDRNLQQTYFIIILTEFITIFLYQIANIESSAPGALLLTWFNLNPSMDK